MSAPVGPFWRYYGGKWRAAPRYPAPEYGHIVEPFAGAAGYACRYPDRKVTLIDASPIIAGIWRYLIATPAAEILALPNIPDGGTVDDLQIPQEARWLAGFWCNNGVAVPRKSPSTWTLSPAHAARVNGWGDKTRARIARDVERIRHWQVIEGDYTAVPDVEATWFVDPPYQTEAGSHYPHQPGDFDALGRWVESRRGQVIACDQDGATWLPWTDAITFKTAAGAKRDGKSAEVIYVRSSLPSVAPQLGLPDRRTA